MRSLYFFYTSKKNLFIFHIYMELISSILNGIVSLFLENPIGQLFGFIAMFVWISGFIVTDDTKTIKIFIASTLFWLLHFIFMWNYWALLATIIWLIRLILSLKYKKSVSVFVAILAISIAFWIYSFDGKLLSTLPLIATAISSYWFFFLEKVRLRILLAGVSLIWLFYHLNTGSMSGVTNEIIVQGTIIYSIYKFMIWAEKKEKILIRLKRKIWKAPARLNFWRYIFYRDKDRFE